MLHQNRLVFTGREFLYIVTALLLFFQIYLQTTIGIMQYFDEIVTIACLLKLLLVAQGGMLEKSHGRILVVMAVITGIGLLSSFLSKIQMNLFPISLDILSTFKVFVVYLGSSYFLKNVSDKSKIIGTLASFIRGFVLVTFVCMILQQLGVLDMGEDIRYGIRSFRFINNGAGQLSILFYSVLLILTLDLKNEKRRKGKLKYIIMALLVWTATMRSRAFMFVILYLYFYWLIIVSRQRFRLSPGNAVVILSALLFFGMDQFETYFNNTKSARANLLKYGIHTMSRFFPMGSGFATYGTDAAVKYYSPLYDEYGFNQIYGLSRYYSAFAHDTYWPAIMAQFGVFGALLMVYLIYRLFVDVLRRAKNNQYTFLAALFVCVTQVASSVATATFFNYVTVGLFFLVPLLFDENSKDVQ